MSKKKNAEKLTPIPKPSQVKPSPPAGGASAPTDAGPDLSHISPGLRDLAVQVTDLDFFARNPRKHTENDLEDTKASLRIYGQVEPLVVNYRTTPPTVLNGNGRLQGVLSMGWTHVAVSRVDLDEAKANALAVVLNRTGEGAGWDKENLELALKDLDDANDPVLDKMLADLAEEMKIVPPLDRTAPVPAPEAEMDRAAELQKKWSTAAGQLWEIPSKAMPGKCHRLLCGDSTCVVDVARVMGGEKAGLMNTDPPYGVAYANDDRPNPGVAKPRVANDLLTDEDLQAFLELAFKAAAAHALEENAAWYMWHAHLTQGYFAAAAAAAAAANVVLHRQIIWIKPVLLLGRGQYHWKHEPCFMGWVKGHQCPDYGLGNGERTQTTVWEVDGVSHADRKEFNHSTPKPVGLFNVPMVKHLKAGEVAFEPFAGSGPQFVAGEQTGRLCYGLELEPKFCAVILERLSAMDLEPRLVSEEAAAA